MRIQEGEERWQEKIPLKGRSTTWSHTKIQLLITTSKIHQETIIWDIDRCIEVKKDRRKLVAGLAPCAAWYSWRPLLVESRIVMAIGHLAPCFCSWEGERNHGAWGGPNSVGPILLIVFIKRRGRWGCGEGRLAMVGAPMKQVGVVVGVENLKLRMSLESF